MTETGREQPDARDGPAIETTIKELAEPSTLETGKPAASPSRRRARPPPST